MIDSKYGRKDEDISLESSIRVFHYKNLCLFMFCKILMNSFSAIKRAKIKELLLNDTFYSENFISLYPQQIERMFYFYDKVFFDDEIQNMLESTNSTVKFEIIKGKKTSIAGKCTTTKKGKSCNFTLFFPDEIYLNLFVKESEKSLKNNGLVCKSRLDCLQLTFEHELIHLINYLWDIKGISEEKGFGKSMYSNHGKAFKCLVKRYFGHTETKHELKRGDVSSRLSIDDVKMGEIIIFTYDDNKLTGKIIKKNPKRAIVELTDGRRFNVYYTGMEKVKTGESNVTTKQENIGTVSSRLSKADFKIGDIIAFIYDDHKLTGKIIKKNPKRGIVELSDGKKFHVYYAGMEKVKGQVSNITKIKIPVTKRRNFKPGDKVTIISLGTTGIIQKVMRKNAIVKIKDMNYKVSMANLS